jgi:hypothetical protein
MATFVSMVTWHRSMAGEADIREQIDSEEVRLYGMGMHSIVFVSDLPGESAAVVVSNCRDHAGAAAIAEVILGDALIRVDSLRFDEPAGRPAWLASVPEYRPEQPRPPRRRREREQALAA